jgi:hypothetical protein
MKGAVTISFASNNGKDEFLHGDDFNCFPAASKDVCFVLVTLGSIICESGVEKQRSNELIRWFCGN